jgi:hypothetical protein
LPEKCTIAPGIDCANFNIKTTSAVIALRNGMGRDIVLQTLAIGDDCNKTPGSNILHCVDLRSRLRLRAILWYALLM